ncbi:uncharacterized protein LOC111674208 [Orussus abietinus]|uniref:uncharacterized protein LOC111674208 n=1 Tax=Orussus abietinus TaxID=222816 RepID=UPI000C715E7B|nr:uncharacterized protein LOC111674208 [Orussus abietinus]
MIINPINVINLLLATFQTIKPFQAREVEYVEDEEEWTDETVPQPSSSVCQDTAVNFDYKKRAVEFWRSGKSGNLKFATVQ